MQIESFSLRPSAADSGEAPCMAQFIDVIKSVEIACSSPRSDDTDNIERRLEANFYIDEEEKSIDNDLVLLGRPLHRLWAFK
jgi:hypothetical protein